MKPQGPRMAAASTQPLHGNTIFWFPIRTVQTSEKTNHPPTRLSTADAICRRRAPSRRQVHCAPPSDRQPDCVRFHARNATSFTRSRFTFRGKAIHTIRISFPNFFCLVSTRSSSLEVDMWCCKRLDASDWPVTTIVRGNAYTFARR